VNIGDPVAVPLHEVIARTRRLAGAAGASVIAVELVGLTPHAALEAYPDDLPIEGFDPDRKVIERLLV
jgi:glutamate formiminotransferase